MVNSNTQGRGISVFQTAGCWFIVAGMMEPYDNNTISPQSWAKVREILAKLYEEVARAAGALGDVHADRLQCRRGCCSCCLDDITVFRAEAHYIRHNCAKILAEESAHAAGACACLDEKGACRIYAHRPYVCRTQGLPLRWLDEYPDGRTVEMRDICPLNEIGPPVEGLEPSDCWQIGPFEELLANLQASIDDGALERVSLRSLWNGNANNMKTSREED